MTTASRGVVLVTGSSTGIGESCALHLDRLGFEVVGGVRRREDGERLAGQTSPRFRWIPLDVTEPGQVRAAMAEVDRIAGTRGLAGLVNNAGVALVSPLECIPMETFRRQLEINVFGLLAVTQAAVPALRTARGRVVNIGSIAGRVVSPLLGAYSASKFAVEAMTDALRLELAPDGIEVSVVEPGMVRTPIWDKGASEVATLREQLSPEAITRYDPLFRALERVVTHPRRRGVGVDVVAEAVVHALTAPRPKTRYLIGRDAKIRSLLRHLPDRWHDRLVRSVMARLAQPRG